MLQIWVFWLKCLILGLCEIQRTLVQIVFLLQKASLLITSWIEILDTHQKESITHDQFNTSQFLLAEQEF